MNEIIVITGQRGKGKTTYIKDQIDCFDRVVIFDLMGEFTYYDTYFELGEFFSKLSKVRKEDFFTINYYNPKTSDIDFEVVCKAICRNENLMFVIDELDYYCSPSYIPKPLAEIIKRGRHQGLNLMVATRRPHEIPRLITSQVSQLITFRHVEPRDLAYMKDICNFDPETVQKLQDFQYLKWDNGKELSGSVKKPRKSNLIQFKDYQKDESLNYFMSSEPGEESEDFKIEEMANGEKND